MSPSNGYGTRSQRLSLDARFPEKLEILVDGALRFFQNHWKDGERIRREGVDIMETLDRVLGFIAAALLVGASLFALAVGVAILALRVIS